MSPITAFATAGLAAFHIAGSLAAAEAPLFPTPLHLVRRVEDPIANTAVEVDEYCIGNKIITVRGAKTAVVDYEKQEILEIDRAASTYSVASFADVAQAKSIADRPNRDRQIQSDSAREWRTTAFGVRSSLTGRSADSFEIASNNIRIEVAVDRQIVLTRAALDAISGASYPNRATPEQEAIAKASVRANGFGLPLDQTTTIDVDAKTHLTTRNAIVRVGSELPPPELLAIPAGATLVDSRAAKMVKQLRELEHAQKKP